MKSLKLRKKIQEMLDAQCALLWLEGSRYEHVAEVKVKNNKLILSLGNNTIRLITFDRYVETSVGMQFWSQGRPGVLYRWLQVPTAQNDTPGDDPTPPVAA